MIFKMSDPEPTRISNENDKNAYLGLFQGWWPGSGASAVSFPSPATAIIVCDSSLN